MTNNKIKLIKRIDVQSTLLAIPVGQTLHIKTNVIKASSIRSAIRVLNKRGYHFLCSEKDLIDQVKVTRLA